VLFLASQSASETKSSDFSTPQSTLAAVALSAVTAVGIVPVVSLPTEMPNAMHIQQASGALKTSISLVSLSV
jgi:hypothetical protein